MNFNYGLTKFLSPEELKLLSSSGLSYSLSEYGYERKRAYIFQNEIFPVDYKITVIKVTYNQNFYNLTHPMVLGALIGLGIKRECIGDIYIDEAIYILVISEIAKYVLLNLTKIDKAKVELEEVDIDVLKDFNLDIYEEKQIIVSSLRLDVIVSAITNFSRKKTNEYINLKNVKVNGIICTNNDLIVKVDDLISIHRFGRTIIEEIVRKTKKNKYVLLIKRTK
ncbi:MAG TPA: hypothetical protein GXZ48_07055 [Acholeplasmataceae bacterium]|nr:hypothetical protein [Acholeplasmataceae bacterium]